jgi:hypothetical protein
MDLQDEYRGETGYSVGLIHDTGTTYYSDDYVKWLENKIKKESFSVYELGVCDMCARDMNSSN